MPVSPSSRDVSTFETVHASLGPVGSLELTTLPARSTATHSDAEGQEMPCSDRPCPNGGRSSISRGLDQDSPEAADAGAVGPPAPSNMQMTATAPAVQLALNLILRLPPWTSFAIDPIPRTE